MFYTINENFVDNFFKDIYTTKPTNRLNSQFEATTLEDGKQQVTINTIGHNPKDITVDVTGTITVLTPNSLAVSVAAPSFSSGGWA